MRCRAVFDRNSFIWIFAFAFSRFNNVLAFTQCYYPDGSIPTDYVWEPCTGAQYSSCCIPSEGDICQENGLCYYPENGQLYRGTCTDRTWNDPSCPSNICVKGFETTWDWVVQCDGSGSSSFACGPVSDGEQQAAACSGSAATDTASIQTTTTTSSAGRYTSPPPINTSLYSVYTDTYTVIITANEQTTTLTSTFESTLTSTLHPTTALGAAATNTATSNNNPNGSGTKRIVLTTGLIIAIIIGPTLALILGISIFIYLRRRFSRKDDAIRLHTPSHPPPNGPVGADQVNPYEMGNDEAVAGAWRKKYEYAAPREDAFEVGGGHGVGREEKRWDEHAAMEMDGFERQQQQQQGLRSPRSPAPVYSEAVMPVELDGTSSFGGRYAR